MSWILLLFCCETKTHLSQLFSQLVFDLLQGGKVSAGPNTCVRRRVCQTCEQLLETTFCLLISHGSQDLITTKTDDKGAWFISAAVCCVTWIKIQESFIQRLLILHSTISQYIFLIQNLPDHHFKNIANKASRAVATTEDTRNTPAPGHFSTITQKQEDSGMS